MPTLSPVLASDVVIMITYDVTTDDREVGVLTLQVLKQSLYSPKSKLSALTSNMILVFLQDFQKLNGQVLSISLGDKSNHRIWAQQF